MSGTTEPKRRLTIRRAGLLVGDIPLESDCLTIGRRSDNDLRLDDPTASGAHAALTLEASPYLEGYRVAYITDLESTNGTTVNGQPVQRQRLNAGDVISIGQHELLFSEEGAMDRTVYLIPDSD